MKIIIQSKLEVGDRVVATFSRQQGTVEAIKILNLPSYNPGRPQTDVWQFEYHVFWNDSSTGRLDVRYLADLLPLEEF